MTDPVDEKIKEFAERLENEDVNKVVPELSAYLTGMADNEKDSIKREQIHGIIISLTLFQGLMAIASTLKEENKKLQSQSNSQLEKIIKLEKRLDDMVAGK